MNQRLTVAAAAAGIAIGLSGILGCSNGESVEAVKVSRGVVQEFIDEQGKTRLPRTHVIAMPYEGRVEEIPLVEGTLVTQGQTVARIVPRDLAIQLAESEAAVDRLAAAIQENENMEIEQRGLLQAKQYVQSMIHAAAAAAKQVEASDAKRNFTYMKLKRILALFQSEKANEQELESAQLDDVEARVEHSQDQLTRSALDAIKAATDLTPDRVDHYMKRKRLHTAVLEKERAEAVARRERAELRVERGEMRSPIDGVVLRRMNVNERLLQGGRELLEIGNLDSLEIEADVLSQEVVRIEP
ncbi:MAG: HlyD family secretion protein, partial [Planctomycetales bacterium]